ncbi:hypothetical protein NAT51_16845 [Flavobacterium amniphilum]|uniref:hypothetical protein n=1 Tax=Flavobacterium amniphilum TaxID=1834035 RepID=UPI002029C949|nr:hypothetical protein [Flavobacterium amniphilum]MCL9807204.1 hypothetical protein [Flavobacterium amniphilum]
MKRRLFVKNASIVSMGILAVSGTNVFANNTEKEKSTVIDLLPLGKASKKIVLKGIILDATTSQPIENCKMSVKAKVNRLFNSTQDILTSNGDYTIISGFTDAGKISKKIKVEITAPGYKPYTGYIYLSTSGCNLHSDEWNYNKNFDYKDCPKNQHLENEIASSFNFRLVK